MNKEITAKKESFLNSYFYDFLTYLCVILAYSTKTNTGDFRSKVFLQNSDCRLR